MGKLSASRLTAALDAACRSDLTHEQAKEIFAARAQALLEEQRKGMLCSACSLVLLDCKHLLVGLHMTSVPSHSL